MDENLTDWVLPSDDAISSPHKPPAASASDAAAAEQQLQHVQQDRTHGEPTTALLVPPPLDGVYAPLPARSRFNSLAEALEQQQKQPLHSVCSTTSMSNGPPIPGSPLASPQSQLSQGFDGMVPPASPFPVHMMQYAAHQSPAPMSASPVHGMPPPQSPGMSPAPNSVGPPGSAGPGPGPGAMYPQPPTPQRPTMPSGMPMTPGGGPQMGPPGTPGGPMTPHPMTPQSQQQQMQQMQHQQQMQQMQQMQQQQQMQQAQQAMQQMQQPGQQMMQPGQPQQMQQMVGQPGMQPGQMMAMTPQQQMMMQGQQPYGYPQQGQWPPQQQMMPAHFVRTPTRMGAGGPMPGGAGGGAPPQRVMIQRVPYPATPGYPPGAMPPQPVPQQQLPPGAQYAPRPMPPQYPQGVGQPGGPGQPPPGYGYPPGTVPMPVQSPVPYPGGATVPPGGMQMAPGTPQYPPQQRQPVQQQQPDTPQQQLQMRPQFMQSPQGTQQQQMMAAQGQQPVYPQSVQQPPQQQQQPGTPQPPFTPNAARYPPGTPTNSSPLHGQQQQQQLLQQQQAAVGGPPGTPGTPVQQQQQLAPDMRSPQLMSPSQAQMMQQQAQQQQPMMHPTARQMSNGDMHMRPVQPPQPVPMQQMHQPMQQQQMVVAPPLPPMQHPGGPYVTRDGGMQPRPDMALVGCHIVVLDWERYTTERTDQQALKQMVRSLGGEIDFGPKAYEQQRPLVTHGIISYLTVPSQRPPGTPPPHIEQALMMMLKEGKRIVTMQWLVDVVESRQLTVPGRIAHLPVPMPLDNLRANHGRIISVSGFADSERGAVKYMVEAIGAKMMPGLTQHTHLLVAKNPSSDKFDRAREWGVPTVNLQWLVDAYLGRPSMDLEHPRYQVSMQPPIEINCGHYTLECLHDNYKHCLAAWRVPIPCNDDIWNRAMMTKQFVDNDEHVCPLKRLKISSLPGPTEDEIKEAHKADEPPEDRKHIVVAFEGLDEELETAFGRKIRMLGGLVTPEVEKCSHLVAIDGKRTVTLLKALALGKNVVSAGWVNCSYQQKKFADTLDFFLRDEEQEKMHNCNFKLSVMRARQAKVFEDCELYITPSVDPSPEVVRSICELGGGLVHSHPPSPAKIIECLETDKPFILVATECDMPILKYLTDAGCTVYSTELVFSAVMRQEVDVKPEYVVSPTACQPAPLRLPPMGAGPASARRTSSGYATPPGATPTQGAAGGSAEFASPHTPRIRAN